VIIDVNEDVTKHLPALSAAGVVTVIGYLNPHGTTGKVITPQRARAIAAAGMTLGLVSEGWGDFAHGEISAAAGKRDAEHALAALPALGAPTGAAVYFAVDTDASMNQVNGLVVPYFRAIQAAFAGSGYRTGAYGSGAICEAVLANRLVDFTWLSCSLGWLGSKEFLASNKWSLRQHVPSKVVGIDCDVDEAHGDFGAFVPFGQPAQGAAVVAAAPQVAASAPQPMPTAAAAPAPATPLQAASNAISNVLLNGIHKYAVNWPSWLQIIIPTGAIEHIAPVLAKAALDAAAGVNEPSPTTEKVK